MLGASSWRVEEITRDRVLVTPAPGEPGKMPFWKGEGAGARSSSARRSASFSRELLAAARAEGRRGSTSAPRRTSLEYLREQERATGDVPTDRTVVVERFRDELGDWRVCMLTPFGGRVHAPWAMAVGARLREALGVEVQTIWSDDGIAFHLADADAPPATDQLLLDAGGGRRARRRRGGADGALRRALPRERGARAAAAAAAAGRAHAAVAAAAKAQDLLPVARKYASFPIVLETYRECLQDVFDLPALKTLLHGLHTRRDRPRRRRDVERVAVRGVAPLRLHRDLHVRGRHAARGAPRAGAVARPRSAARAARPGGAARADRRRRAGGGRGVAAAEAAQRRRAARPAAAARRTQLRVRRRRSPRRSCASGVPSAFAIGGERGARRGRGRGPLPRRARRHAAVRAARRVPRGRPGFAAPARAALRARARAVHVRAGEGGVRHRRRGASRRARAARRSSSAGSCAPAAASASGAIPRCCAGCGARRSPRCAARSSRRSRRRSAASCRAGTASTAARRCARRSSRCRRCRCRCRCGSRRC